MVDLGNRGKPLFQIDEEQEPETRESERLSVSEPSEFDLPDEVLSIMQERAEG